MVSPLSPLQIGPQEQPDLVGSYLGGRAGAQRVQMNDQAIQQNKQAMSQADIEHNVQRLKVANRIFTKAKELATPQERAAFMASLNDEMLKSVGADKQTLSQTGLDDVSLDAAIAQTGSALGMHGGPSAGEREFNALSKGLSPEDSAKARRVALGLDSRAVGSSAETIANTGMTNKVADSQAVIEGSKEGAKTTADINARVAGGGRAEETEALGKGRGANVAEAENRGSVRKEDAAAALPKVTAAADKTIGLIDELLQHPGRDMATGGTAWVPPVPGTKQAGFINRFEQIKGKVFLEAFNSIKGAGSITEQEGKAATMALARLDRAVSKEEFDAAAEDFKQEVRGLQKLTAERAGGSSSGAKSAPKKLTYDPATGGFK